MLPISGRCQKSIFCVYLSPFTFQLFLSLDGTKILNPVISDLYLTQIWRLIMTFYCDFEFWRLIMTSNFDAWLWLQILTFDYDFEIWRWIMTMNFHNGIRTWHLDVETNNETLLLCWNTIASPRGKSLLKYPVLFPRKNLKKSIPLKLMKSRNIPIKFRTTWRSSMPLVHWSRVEILLISSIRPTPWSR